MRTLRALGLMLRIAGHLDAVAGGTSRDGQTAVRVLLLRCGSVWGFFSGAFCHRAVCRGLWAFAAFVSSLSGSAVGDQVLLPGPAALWDALCEELQLRSLIL